MELLAVLAIALGYPAMIVFLVTQEHRKLQKQKAVILRWKNIAELPGLDDLHLLASNDSMAGEIKGINVRLSLEVRQCVKIEAQFHPPLDLGLKIEAAGANASNELYVADNAFAAHFATFTNDKDRTLNLLDAKLRREIVAHFSHQNTGFSLNDHRARLRFFENRSPKRDLMRLVALVRHINERRKKMPPDFRLRGHHRKWSAFAEKNGFECSTTPLGLSGVVDGASIQAYAIGPHDGPARLEVALKFHERLDLGLTLRPFGLSDHLATTFGGEDHRLDDPDFDDTFRVTTHDHEGTDRLLDDEVRQSLLKLHATLEPISLSDEALSIRLSHLPEDPSVVLDMVRQLKGLATKIEESRRHEVTRGPYR